jgi:hypothetical protein
MELEQNALPAEPELVLTPQPAPASQPSLDDSAVRAAMLQADSGGSSAVEPLPTQAPVETPKPLEVPEKFKKPDGTVDVEKLQASTRQLDEALKVKEKTIDEVVQESLRDYREKENAFRNRPNPEKLKASLEVPVEKPLTPPLPTLNLSDNQIVQKIQQDLQSDPVGTIVDLVRVISKQETEPLQKYVSEQTEAQRIAQKEAVIKQSLADIANRDRRILDPQIFEAVKAELNSDPDYWNLKNPYKAAWNEVKERLRLGEPQVQAQPSKGLSPILGGGTPPPAPSVSGAVTPRNVQAAISEARSAKELDALGQALRQLLSQNQG